jgi:hypothetical protein
MASPAPRKSLTVDECQSKAEDCCEMAEVAIRPEHKIMLQHLAETWDRIAADVAGQKQVTSRPRGVVDFTALCDLPTLGFSRLISHRNRRPSWASCLWSKTKSRLGF